ncbi:MAG: T9SS type A sorting domain-containing protein [Saprospiraceae bacterium]
MRSIFIFICLLLTSQLFSNTYIIDPINGSVNGDGSAQSPWLTLEQVIADNLIKSYSYTPLPYDQNSQLTEFNTNAPISAGDTLILKSGLHGDIFLRGYHNTTPIVVMAGVDETPIIKKIRIISSRNWIFNGLTVSAEPYQDYNTDYLVSAEDHGWHGPASIITISNCHIFSTQEPWTIANDWITKASSGVNVTADSCMVSNNTIENINFGISLRSNYSIAYNNTITNFSGDGARILGTHLLFDQNTIKNCYAVDENHDDGIQSFTTNGLVVDDIIISNNTIINYEDPNQPLLGPLQGIGCFDGFFNRWEIFNNLIIVNHWHGISLYGAKDCKIYNNTVIDPTPNDTPGPSWIKINEHKDGSPSENCIVKNNVANSFQVPTEFVVTNGLSNNYVILDNYNSEFVDPDNLDYYLTGNSNLIDAGDFSISPLYDIKGTPRDSFPDIGAYEYIALVNTKYIDSFQFALFPNPSQEYINISEVKIGSKLTIFDANGKVWLNKVGNSENEKLHIDNLANGIYFLKVEINNLIAVRKFVKSN